MVFMLTAPATTTTIDNRIIEENAYSLNEKLFLVSDETILNSKLNKRSKSNRITKRKR